MSESSSASGWLDELAEEFVQRHHRGERPTIDEYVSRYPELADAIRDLFPALALMQNVMPEPGAATGPYLGSRTGPSPLDRLGDYRILREVGRGGMGIVYEAEQESLGRHVALKVLPAHALLDAQRLQRFEREAKAAARLHHTNIVPVYGVGEQDGLHYYVMQFIQGLALDEVLVELKKLRHMKDMPATTADEGNFSKRHAQPSDISAVQVAHALLTGHFGSEEGVARPESSKGVTDPDARPSKTQGVPPNSAIRLPGSSGHSSLSESGRQYWLSVARIGIQVAEALAYARGQGTLHRDIKPSNLLLDTHGTVWVTDFGLAKAADSADLTEAGDIVGTLRYMAPERFLGHADQRSDLYALGLTLYELLTLRPAFAAGDRHKLIDQVKNEEPPRPCKVDRSVPRDLETVVLKAMAKDPGHRYASAGELAEDLRRFVEDKPIQARRVGSAERLWRWCRRNPAVASLSAMLIIALVAGTAFSLAFAVQADGQRKRAEGIAEDKRQARLAKDKAQKELLDAQDGLEQAVLRGLARPLDPEGGDFLNEPEAEALWELVLRPGDRLWWRFIEEGTRSPLTAAQLRARAEPFFVAAVGLDANKHQQTEQMLMQKLLGEQALEFGQDPRKQMDLTIAAASLGNLNPTNARTVAMVLVQSLELDDKTVPRLRYYRMLWVNS